VGVFVTIFSGCAVFDSFMAGYRPPQTIADLLLEQRLAAGELPPELGMNGEQKNTIGQVLLISRFMIMQLSYLWRLCKIAMD